MDNTGSLEPSLELQPGPENSTGKTSMVPPGGPMDAIRAPLGVRQPLPINPTRGFMSILLASPQISPARHQPQHPGCCPVEQGSSLGSPSPSLPHAYRVSRTSGCSSFLQWGKATLIPRSPSPLCCCGAQGVVHLLVEPQEPHPCLSHLSGLLSPHVCG